MSENLGKSDLDISVDARSEQADASLDKLINSFERLDAQLSGILKKLDNLGNLFDGFQNGARGAESVAKNADKAAQSIKRMNDAAKGSRNDTPVSVSASGAQTFDDGQTIYMNGISDSAETAEEKARRLEGFNKRTARIVEGLALRTRDVQTEIDKLTGSGGAYSRNVTGNSDVGVLFGKNDAKSDIAYANKVASAYQNAANAVAKLRVAYSQKVSAGGILSDKELQKMESARARLDTLSAEFESLMREGFSDKMLDDSVLGGRGMNGLFDDVRAVSEQNKALKEWQTNVDRVSSSYQKLVDKMEQTVASGGILKSSDIRKAQALKSRIDELSAAANSVAGATPFDTGDFSKRFDSVMRKSRVNSVQKEMDSLSASIEKMRARLATLKNSRETAIANGRSVAGINSRIRQVEESIRRANAQMERLRVEMDKAADSSASLSSKLTMASFAARTFPRYFALATRRCGQLVGKVTGLNFAFRVISGSIKTVWRLLKYRVLRTLVVNATKDIDTCLRYVAKAQSSFNGLMNSIRAGWANIGAAITSALVPFISASGPSAVSVMERLANATHNVGMAVAAMTGAKQYTKMTAKVSDFAGGLDDANGSAKKLKNTLAGFDTFNLLDDTTGSGSSSGVSYDSETINLDLEDGSVTDKLATLGKRVRGVAEGIKGVLSDAWSSAAPELGLNDYSFLDFIDEKLSGLSSWLKKNRKPLADILSSLVLIFGDVKDIVSKLCADVITFVADLLGVKEGTTAVEKLAGILDTVHRYLNENTDAAARFIKRTAGMYMVGSALSFVSKGIAALSGIGKLKGVGASVLKLGAKLVTVGKSVGAVFSGASAAATSAGGAAAAAAKAIPVVGAAVAGVALGLGALKVFAPDVFDEAAANWKWLFKQVGKDISKTFHVVVDGVSNFVMKRIPEAFNSATEVAKQKFSDMKTNIETKLDSLGVFVRQKVPAFFDSAWSSVKMKFAETKSHLEEKLMNFGSFVRLQIPAFFSSAWASVKSSWNDLWTWFQGTRLFKFFDGLGDGISAAMSKLRGVGSASAVSAGAVVHARASGGTVNAGQLFIANERGPELVGTIGGKSTVANQAQVYRAMYDGIYRAVVAGLRDSGSGDSDGDIYLTVDLDGDPVYKNVVRRNKAQTRQTGKNPLLA